MMKIFSVILFVTLSITICATSKSYPVPVFVWSESDRFMPEGRTWHSQSVSTDEVREYVVKLSGPHGSSNTALPLTAGASPEVMVMFLEPGLFFGKNERIGGIRLSKDQSQLKKLKLMVEGAKSSIVLPYSYDDSLGKLSQEQRSYYLISKLQETFDDFFEGCKDCSVVVEPMDATAEVAWSPFFFSENRISETNSIETYFQEHHHLFFNGKTDLVIVHLPADASLSAYDAKISSVISTISRETKDYVALLSSDDMYLPTHSTEGMRVNPEKLEWKERKASRQLELNEEDTNDMDSTGEYKYPNRWPEFVWEFLICWFTMTLIFSYGFCCLFGMDTPTRFDNPKEKGL